jgi:hypothetical protein
MFPMNATSARDILAVVLCPARAFAGCDAEGAAAAEVLRPVKVALIKRFRDRARRAMRN